MQDTAVAHAGDPIFVRVTDLDRNRDGGVVETVDVRVSAAVTGDSEVLRLSETGPNTGVFVGYVPTATGGAGNDCALQVERNAVLDATYVDPTDTSDRRWPMRWSIRTAWSSIRRPACRSTAHACVLSTHRAGFPPPCTATTASAVIRAKW